MSKTEAEATSFIRQSTMEQTTSELIWLILLMTLILRTLATENDKREFNKIQLFSGLHLERNADYILYESTIPLLLISDITIKIPQIQESAIKQNCLTGLQNEERLCNIQNELLELETQIFSEIKNHDAHHNIPYWTKKSKRGLTFMGDFFKWCCNVATTNQVTGIFDNQKTMAEHTNLIIDAVNSQDRDLIQSNLHMQNFTNKIKNLTSKIHTTFKLLDEKVNSIRKLDNHTQVKQLYQFIQKTWSYVLINYYQDHITEIIQNCQNNKLSTQHISRPLLQLHLGNITRKAETRNLELAITNEHLDLYYTLPLTECKIMEDNLLVKVNIPLRRKNMDYLVYSPLQTPVVWDNKICYLEHFEVKLIIKSKETIKLINKDYDNHCNGKSHPLCLLPRKTTSATSLNNCLKEILSTGSISKLAEHCEFTCTDKPQTPVITKLTPTRYLLTNLQANMTLQCDNYTHVVPRISTGVLKADIPCECELWWKSDILITAIRPCDTQDQQATPEFIQLIPATWSKLKMMELFPIQSGIVHEFRNLTDILDTNWTLHTNTYATVNRKKLEHFKLEHDEYDIFSDTRLIIYILIAWMGILTLIILILILCLYLQAVKLKYCIPRKDYPGERQ